MAIAVLLGAGASTDAGIPKSVDLTREMYEYLAKQEDDEKKRQAKALGTVIAGLGYRNAQDGRSPYELIDVEQVVTTVQMLANRDDSEVMPLSPFISGWSQAINAVDQSPVSEHLTGQAYDNILSGVRRIQQSDSVPPPDTDSERSRFQIALRILLESNRGSWTNGIFKMINYAMTDFLVDRIQLRPDVDLSYLKPLLNLSQDTLSIYSLNYDTVIEQLCHQEQRRFSLGVKDYPDDSGLVEFEDNAVRLVKLHGSIDWRWTRYRAAFQYPRVCRVSDPSAIRERPILAAPALIFGQGNKLTVEGPFLELLNFFNADLESHDQLIVVGYSFRDAHINHYLLSWMTRKPKERRMLIVGGSSFATSTVPFVQEIRQHPGTLDLKARAKQGSGVHNAVIEAQSWELKKRHQV